MSNFFFKNRGPFKVSEVINFLNLDNSNFDKNHEIKDIKDLLSSSENDITFFHSKKYKDFANKTKASFCITSEVLKSELPKSCNAIVVDNVLVCTSKITSLFYPDSINDDFDKTVTEINETEFKDKVSYGKNVLIGKNTSIGIKKILQVLASTEPDNVFITVGVFSSHKLMAKEFAAVSPNLERGPIDIAAVYPR